MNFEKELERLLNKYGVKSLDEILKLQKQILKSSGEIENE